MCYDANNGGQMVNAQEVNAAKIEHVPTGKLIPYANNARTHSAQQVAQIAASIREFGFNNPILIADDLTVIAGHGRLQAAQSLGLQSVPCLRLSHLTKTQRRAYVLADNRIAMNAGWDDDLLAVELEALAADGVDVALLGFDSPEIAKIMGEEDDPWAEEASQQVESLTHKIIIQCRDEEDQTTLAARLEEEGYQCQILIL